ncbi:protein HOTHEAD-like [Tripterygium wilfordii]|uniref:protein HOTHEAD-like n=1 Tax=Tripterygium wilfordii TaxID=458696 RepID=UPI0018F7FC0B|nr:protein HOTHEAD-like [Tripterygium wilfordii]
MELAQIMRSFVLLLAFILPLPKLSVCLPTTSSPQGRNLPFMTSDVRQVSGKSFDYIVVGGGTTGCSLAATLSERFSVLLVERGGSPYGNCFIEDKKFYGFSLIQTDEFTSVAQAFISKDRVSNIRGRVLGGSSAINGGFYSRASKDFIKRAGWDEDLVMEAYGWVESKIVHTPELTIWQSVVQFGFLEAGILPYNGFNLEHVEGTKISGSVFDNSGKRHTSADLLEAGNPKNITVLLNATVKDVIIHRNGINESRVHGIKFIKSDGSIGQSYEAYLNKPNNSISRGEVILSAGALGSPQVLLLSGIGPPEHLKNFNIPVQVELEGVGQGMIDNPSIALLVDTKPQKLYPDTPQVVGITKGFKFIVEAGVIPISFNATRMPIAIKIAFPASKGKLELNSTDPRQNPSVEFNYLSNKLDLEQCVEMAQLVGRVARSEPVAFFVGNEPKNNLMSTSEEELKRFCKKNVRTYYHYHGGCAVGSVVDKDYKVYGVKGLRVIDGSTLKESPGTNPMATLMMLGRYQGIKILSERKDA